MDEIYYEDSYGFPIERTPNKYPYSYDGYVIHRLLPQSEANNTLYTDRLSMWDYEKKKRLMKKHFVKTGDWWNEHTPAEIESFLRDWCEDPELELVCVMQYCNVSNGCPLWRLDFKQTMKNAT